VRQAKSENAFQLRTFDHFSHLETVPEPAPQQPVRRCVPCNSYKASFRSV
jgi:hypothetical protein